MKRLGTALPAMASLGVLALGVLLTAAESLPAQEAEKPSGDLRPGAVPTLAVPSLTPEMWLYEQERRRNDDPGVAVRRNAAGRAAERHRRIESRKWFGYSLSRPVASPDHWHSAYLPHWQSSASYSSWWSGYRHPGVARSVWNTPRPY